MACANPLCYSTEKADQPYGLCHACYFKPEIARVFRRNDKSQRPCGCDHENYACSHDVTPLQRQIYDALHPTTYTMEQEFMNARWIISIKRDLIPDDSIYMFADPKFIGKSYHLDVMQGFNEAIAQDHVIPFHLLAEPLSCVVCGCKSFDVFMDGNGEHSTYCKECGRLVES